MKKHLDKVRKNNNGITLIALVITIIVILILAGVSITMISGNNGILTKVGETSETQKDAVEEEEVKMAVITAIASDDYGNLTDANLREAITNAFGNPDKLVGTGPWIYIGERNTYEIEGNGNVEISTPATPISDLKTAGNKVSDTTKAEDDSGDIVYIPGGFGIAEDSATDADSGIVIEDEDNNQFVWVPVPDAIYDSSRDSELPKSTSNGTSVAGGNTYTPMAIETSTGNYSGLLYNYSSSAGAYLMYPSNENYQGTTSGYREPDTVSRYNGTYSYYDNDLTNLEYITDILTNQTAKYADGATFKETMKSDYNKMVASVKKYGGFYVGRYESSINDTDVIKKTVKSVQGATSITADTTSGNTWYGLYAREKNFSTSYVQGSMIWGSQYDAMMNWMSKNSINVAAETPIVGASRNTDITTGTEDADQLNKVYDLLGNSCELTLEARNEGFRAYRGGCSDFSSSPCSRIWYCGSPDIPYSFLSSRLTLYII